VGGFAATVEPLTPFRLSHFLSTGPSKRAEPKKIDARKAKREADARRDGKLAVRNLLELCGAENGIWTRDALPAMKAINNGPWRNYAGVVLTEMKLAELVSFYGVESRQVNKKGKDGIKKNLNGYRRFDLEAAVSRYFSDLTP
jgi:hypothetical protein